MTTTSARATAPPLGPRALALRKSSPIKWLAVVGASCWLFEGYLFTRWITSGNATPTPTGPDPVPGWMRISITLAQVVSPLLLLACVYYFLIRPWRRGRQIPFSGLLLLGLFSAVWQDLGSNFFRHVYTYNSAFINYGSWYNFIPGWSSPRANQLAEPLLFTLPIYVWGVIPPAMGFAFLMRKARSRWPQLSNFRLVLVALLAAASLDLVLELGFARLGFYVFAGTIPGLTIFQGHYYQFPIYEMLLLGGYLTAYAALIYFRDDRGNSVAERGVERIHTTERKKTLLRFLALSGYCNVALLSYNVIFALISLFPTFTWADDIVCCRSYLRDGLCGPGALYACPANGPQGFTE